MASKIRSDSPDAKRIWEALQKAGEGAPSWISMIVKAQAKSLAKQQKARQDA